MIHSFINRIVLAMKNRCNKTRIECSTAHVHPKLLFFRYDNRTKENRFMSNLSILHPFISTYYIVNPLTVSRFWRAVCDGSDVIARRRFQDWSHSFSPFTMAASSEGDPPAFTTPGSSPMRFSTIAQRSSFLVENAGINVDTTILSPSVMSPPSSTRSTSMRRASMELLNLGLGRSRRSIIDVRNKEDVIPLVDQESVESLLLLDEPGGNNNNYGAATNTNDDQQQLEQGQPSHFVKQRFHQRNNVRLDASCMLSNPCHCDCEHIEPHDEHSVRCQLFSHWMAE